MEALHVMRPTVAKARAAERAHSSHGNSMKHVLSAARSLDRISSGGKALRTLGESVHPAPSSGSEDDESVLEDDDAEDLGHRKDRVVARTRTGTIHYGQLMANKREAKMNKKTKRPENMSGSRKTLEDVMRSQDKLVDDHRAFKQERKAKLQERVENWYQARDREQEVIRSPKLDTRRRLDPAEGDALQWGEWAEGRSNAETCQRFWVSLSLSKTVQRRFHAAGGKKALNKNNLLPAVSVHVRGVTPGDECGVAVSTETNPTDTNYQWRSPCSGGSNFVTVLPSDPAYRLGEYFIAVFSSKPCNFRIKVSQAQYYDETPYLKAQKAQAMAFAGIRQFIARADHRRVQCKGGGSWRDMIQDEKEGGEQVEVDKEVEAINAQVSADMLQPKPERREPRVVRLPSQGKHVAFGESWRNKGTKDSALESASAIEGRKALVNMLRRPAASTISSASSPSPDASRRDSVMSSSSSPHVRPLSAASARRPLSAASLRSNRPPSASPSAASSPKGRPLSAQRRPSLLGSAISPYDAEFGRLLSSTSAASPMHTKRGARMPPYRAVAMEIEKERQRAKSAMATGGAVAPEWSAADTVRAMTPEGRVASPFFFRPVRALREAFPELERKEREQAQVKMKSVLIVKDNPKSRADLYEGWEPVKPLDTESKVLSLIERPPIPRRCDYEIYIRADEVEKAMDFGRKTEKLKTAAQMKKALDKASELLPQGHAPDYRAIARGVIERIRGERRRGGIGRTQSVEAAGGAGVRE